MDVGTLETWLWDAACEIRGPLDAPKFKDYILPLVFLKRLSDVFDDEVARSMETVFQTYPYWRQSARQEREVRRGLYTALIDAGVDKVTDVVG